MCAASYHVWDLPSVIICDDVAKDLSDCPSPLTSAKSYFSEPRYSARYVPANIPWPMTDDDDDDDDNDGDSAMGDGIQRQWQPTTMTTRLMATA